MDQAKKDNRVAGISYDGTLTHPGHDGSTPAAEDVEREVAKAVNAVNELMKARMSELLKHLSPEARDYLAGVGVVKMAEDRLKERSR